MRPFVLLIAIVELTPFARAGNVLVVGPQPTQIAEIQAAIDAAVDGDVILVKSGTYATFSVPNKEVTIVADVSQTVNVDGAMRVRNLTAGRTVVLSGMHATGRFGTGNEVVGDGFFATNCAGAIRVQDCVLLGYNGTGVPCPLDPRHGAEIENCADVAFVRCTLYGSTQVPRNAPYPGNPPDSREGEGLIATLSSVAIYDSMINGGWGGTMCSAVSGGGDGTDGGDSVLLSSSLLFSSESTLAGGPGMSFNTYPGFQGQLGGWGGNGIEASAGSVSHLLQCSVYGGSAGYNLYCGYCGSCCNGYPGSNYLNSTGASDDLLSGAARILAGADIARESTSLALSVTGPPGDIAAIGIRRTTGFAWIPARFGVQLLSSSAPPMRYAILGTIPASGVLSTSLMMPSVPITDPGQTYHMQLITSGSTGVPHLGSPLSIAVVDQSF